MKAYLDNDMVSSIARGDMPGDVEGALMQLLELGAGGRLEIVTSELARREIERYEGQDQRILNIVYLLLGKVQFVEDHKLLGFQSQWDERGGISYPLIEDHPISAALRRMGLQRTDAHHLMLAILARCDAFVTYDGGILHRGAAIERDFHIRVLEPSVLVEELRRGK